MPDQTALGALGGIFNTVTNGALSYFNNVKNDQTRQEIALLDDQKAVTIAGINSGTLSQILIFGGLGLIVFALIRAFVR